MKITELRIDGMDGNFGLWMKNGTMQPQVQMKRTAYPIIFC
jgi:hypothetical protein